MEVQISGYNDLVLVAIMSEEQGYSSVTVQWPDSDESVSYIILH